MKIQSFYGAYESPTSSVIIIYPAEVLCSSVEQNFSSGSVESFTKDDFNW